MLDGLYKRVQERMSSEKASFYVVLCLFSTAAGLAVVPFIPDSQAHAAVTPSVTLEGSALPKAAQRKAFALKIARRYLAQRLTLHVGPWQFETTRAGLGVRVDLRALEQLLEAAADPRSALIRLHVQERGDLPLDLRIPAELAGERAQRWLSGVRDQVFQRERDARVDLRTGAIVAEQTGRSLDVHGTLDALEKALRQGAREVFASVHKTAPSRTKKALEKLSFESALATFETHYSVLDRERTYNLRVAARHLDGIVLMPGEELDFNKIVGERSEANGFRPAKVIAGGELTDGVGGGTCQIAGTLYAAVFFAGLPVLEQSTHTRPSSYLKLGLDATVSYPKLNFRFRNDLPYAIAVGVEVANGRVRVELRGAQQLQREVSFVRRIDEIKPYAESFREDPALPRGVKVLAQRGVPGFVVTSFRLIRDTAREQITRERRHDVYPQTTQIWRVGTGAPASPGYKPPAGDTHGEYRADEYLILSMGPSTQGVEETVRRAGRSGAPGWTQKEGMPSAVP